MSGFSEDWLASREAVDRRARSTDLVATLPRKFTSIVDLGAGTGSNLRWLSPQLDSGQFWTLIDNDKRLLIAARKAIRAWAKSAGYQARGRGADLTLAGTDFACQLKTRELDLNRQLSEVELPRHCLVTASALLDLVSRSWLEKLIERIAAAEGFVLWALSYDGSVTIDPRQDLDEEVISLVNRHQLSDKGFGPALGPDAWLVARSLLEQAGLNVRVVQSRWQCGRDDRALLKMLIEGWADAAIEINPDAARRIQRWRKQRVSQAAKGKLQVSVGHRDIAAWPQTTSGG